MAKSRSKLIIAGIVLLTLLVAAGGFAGWRAYQRRHDPLARMMEQARAELKALPKDSPNREEIWDRHCDAMYEWILARHPELAVVYRDVPDERNGFRKWLEFEARHPEGRLDLPKEIERMTNGEAWDAERMDAWLKEHAALMEEIAAIGRLPEQSLKGVRLPNCGYVEARLPKQCSDLLLLQARLQAERKQPEAALQSVRAAMGLADHLDQIETPCLLHATVGSLIRLNVSRRFFEGILPVLPADSLDLPAWRQAMAGPPVSPTELGRIMRGEWHVGLRYLVLPLITMDFKNPVPRDLAKFVDRWAEAMARRVEICNTRGWVEVRPAFETIQTRKEHVTFLSRQLLETMDIGSSAWANGWIRAQILLQQKNAAFAHLLGEPLPNEPIMGKPFVWDEASQSIRFPEDERLKEFELKPLVVRRSSR